MQGQRHAAGSGGQGGSQALLVMLVVTVFALLAALVMPWLKAGSMGAGQTTEVLRSEQRVKQLEAEVAQLRKVLQEVEAAQSAPAADGSKQPTTAIQKRVTESAKGGPNPTFTLDMYDFLGAAHYYSGVSFDAFKCGLPYTTIFPDITDANITHIGGKVTQELHDAMSKILGRTVGSNTAWQQELLPDATFDQQMAVMIRDPRTLQWRDAMTAVLSKYLLFDNKNYLLRCPEQDGATAIDIRDIGRDPCPSLSLSDRTRQLGFHAVPHGQVSIVAHDAIRFGLCMKSPDMRTSFAEWIMQDRIRVPEWKTFNTLNYEHDAVLLLFDLLYESMGVFKRQYWLGVITMQNPFDMMSICDIIYTVQPDLIIETGTANGGSALLWASMLHLSGLTQSRVITVDREPPSWDPSIKHWGGQPRGNASSHELWKKHITFIKGGSTSDEVVSKVKALAASAKKVMVLLDSAHDAKHVVNEMQSYCMLVSVGSYCIIEDTKLSRWTSDSTFLASTRDWLHGPAKGKFEVDRDKELLYTHHPMGYLKRVKE